MFADSSVYKVGYSTEDHLYGRGELKASLEECQRQIFILEVSPTGFLKNIENYLKNLLINLWLQQLMSSIKDLEKRLQAVEKLLNPKFLFVISSIGNYASNKFLGVVVSSKTNKFAGELYEGTFNIRR